MTREEAVLMLTRLEKGCDEYAGLTNYAKEAFQMAITALQTDGDCISRQETLQAMDTWDKFGCDPDGKLVRYDEDKHYIPYVHYEDMVHAVKHMPSVQPDLSEAYAKAVRNWLVEYQVKTAELKARYTPYEVLGWVVSDWRKDNGIW